MLAKRLIKSNDAGGGGACTNTVDLYNPFPDGGGLALYQLNGDATDVSGNYDGTASNVTYGTGQFGQAGVFNGSSSSINTNFAQNTSNAFSWSLWFNADSTQNGLALIIDTTSNVSPYPGVGIGLSGNTELAAFIGGSTFPTSTTITSNSWVHTVYTNDGNGNFSFYVNGIAIFTNVFQTTNVYSGQNILLGNTTTWNKFKGSIDQVRIFNRALRPYEVEALYTEEYCTPTIVPSEHFNTVTYTGNGSSQSISVGFQPDLVWIKNRAAANPHSLQDTVRGDFYLRSNATDAEAATSGFNVSSFNSNGITVKDDTNGAYNVNGSVGGLYSGDAEYVAWNFKAGGAAVENTDGTITSQVSANTEAGFSVVTYTAPSSGTNARIGHGLGVAPKVMINKRRNGTSDWYVFNTILDGSYDFLKLNETGAKVDDSNTYLPTSTTISSQNFTSSDWVVYCFAEVEGFSNFGSYVGTYTGTGAVPDNTIITGFEPAFLMIKSASIAEQWQIYDNKRNVSNPINNVLSANNSGAEATSTDYDIEFLENGFNVKSVMNFANQNGTSYIYMAFAADPTTIEPSLEDSFNTVLYTGQGGSESITSVGFQPDLTWIKSRETSGKWNVLYDSIRGTNKMLSSNATDSEATYGSVTPTANGFDLGSLAGDLNSSGEDYIAWNWKGAEIPAINSNGSIPSVVSANPAAGFSIVSYTGNSTAGATVGHGLSDAPSIVIVKSRTSADYWCVGGSTVGDGQNLYLNDTGAKLTRDRVKSVQTTTFTLGSHQETNSTNSYIAYCFAEVAGFSKFGSYTGNGGTNTPIDCGFEPAFILVKKTDSSGGIASWGIFDNKRSPSNPRNKALFPNLTNAESTEGTYFNFSSTGFTAVGSGLLANYSGSNYIYMAFANQF